MVTDSKKFKSYSVQIALYNQLSHVNLDKPHRVPVFKTGTWHKFDHEIAFLLTVSENDWYFTEVKLQNSLCANILHKLAYILMYSLK